MSDSVFINQSIAILVDGNNIQISLHSRFRTPYAMVNFDALVPRLVGNRTLKHLVYFREGRNISKKFERRLRERFHGRVIACGRNADVPLTIQAVGIHSKVDTVILCTGDSDYVPLVQYLQNHGVRVEICAVRESLSEQLIEAADQYYFIDNEDVFFFDKNLTTPNGGQGYAQEGQEGGYQAQETVWEDEHQS